MPKPLVKQCSTCRLAKPLTAFGRCRTRHDGFQPQCRACRVELAAAHYERNKERLKTQAREYARKYQNERRAKRRAAEQQGAGS